GRVKVQSRKEPVTAYRSSELGEQWGLAFTGVLLDWTLRYPDISLQQLLGVTASSGASRSPETRYRIYQELITHPGGELSQAEISHDIGNGGRDAVNQTLYDLKDLGILEIDSRLSYYNPLFQFE